MRRAETRILIPVKNRENAKQRLSSILSPWERRLLAEAMLEDVFTTLGTWPERPPVSVVTNDACACELARHFSFEIIHDAANPGESEAISLATAVCEEQQTGSLVLPGDIPLLQVSEVEQILEAAPSEGPVLVPSADGQGSNAVLRRPAGLFPLEFGGQSFTRHLQRARATGKPCVTLELPGIALDVDTPQDLSRLLAFEVNNRAQQLLRRWNLPERLLAVANA